MKQIIISASFILFSALAFTSCQKCETCTTKVDTDVAGFETSVSESQEYCGKELDNKPPEISTTVTVGPTTTTTSITCVKS